MERNFYFKMWMVAALLCLPLLSTWAQIEIATVEDLQKIGADEAYPLTGSYVLVNDIDMSGVNDWVPIGMQTGHAFSGAGKTLTNFSGTFDGQKHAIKNLTYTFNGAYAGVFTEDELTGGIFGRISGTVKNLELRNLTITGNCAGALAASLAPSTTENVSVIACTISGGSEVGGLSGRTNNNGQTVRNCYIDPTTKITGEAKVGGYVGSIGQAIAIVMTNCYTAATIECTGSGTVYGLIGDFAIPANAGNMGLNAVFVMNQAATGTSLEPFTPDNEKIGVAGSTYFACSEYFPSVDAGNAKTLSELQEKATYTGWDFDEIWKIEAGKFPIFQWQEYPSTGISPVKAEPLWIVSGLNQCIEVSVFEPLFLSVYDLTGKTLFAAQVNSQVSIPANPGIYILKAKSAGKETAKKIIVQ